MKEHYMDKVKTGFKQKGVMVFEYMAGKYHCFYGELLRDYFYGELLRDLFP